MTTDVLQHLFLIGYAGISLGLLFYGMNCYVMLFLFFRHRRREERANAEFLSRAAPLEPPPHVTTQLPIYNERFVAERLLAAVVALDYPRERHEIQVLDDSDDETSVIVARAVERYRSMGVDIVHLRRDDRSGFKAGALNFGMTLAKGELLAVFDADFLPEADFLRRTVPFFYQDLRVALVQTRWGHVNREHSFLTRAQSVGIDGHFVIEQGARCWNGLFMNFNGTAGVWRREAIEAAGGWEADTLTEDLDLSYRVQLAGWRMKYLADVITPSELPADINGLKSQQHRWAKGSIQTAIKILPRVFSARVPPFRKIQAAFHLTHYLIHPLMLLGAVCSLPALFIADYALGRPFLLVAGLFFGLATLSPSILYLLSQRVAYADWTRRIWILPALVAIGIGIAVNNSRAVLEALLGRESPFIRTPKYGIRGRESLPAPRHTSYRIPVRLSPCVEIALGLYGFVTLVRYGEAGRWAVVPFLFLSAIGFTLVGLLSWRHARRAEATGGVRSLSASAG